MKHGLNLNWAFKLYKQQLNFWEKSGEDDKQKWGDISKTIEKALYFSSDSSKSGIPARISMLESDMSPEVHCNLCNHCYTLGIPGPRPDIRCVQYLPKST